MKKVIFSPVFLGIWIIAVGAVCYSLLQNLIGIRGANARLTELQQKNAQIQQNIEGLEIKISKAETPFAKERIIREELGLQLPGETVVQMNKIAESLDFSPPRDPASPSGEIQHDSVKNLPIILRWVKLFFGS